MKSEKQSKNFLLANELIREELGSGISREIMGFNESIMMVKVIFEDGAIGYEHQHPHVQTTYVESGEFEVTIDGKPQLLKAGEGFFVPSDLLHGAVCKKAGVLVDVFNPVREDFLK